MKTDKTKLMKDTETLKEKLAFNGRRGLRVK